MRLSLKQTIAGAIAGLAALAATAPAALAQAWPQGTVKIIVPFPPGGGADSFPRVLTEALSKAWGQAVVIENRAGAGGNVGAELVSRAAPDGLTLLHSPTPVYAVNALLYKKLNYDPTALKPVILLAEVASSMSVHPSTGANTVKEFIAKAKAEPGLSYGSQGNGTTTHLAAEMFSAMVGVKLNHVPYRGSGPLMNDLVGGHIKLAFDNLASALTQHQAGTIKVLAVASEKRSPFVPEIPTMIEAGVPDFIAVVGFGFAAPPGTPDALINKINGDIAKLLATEDVSKRFAALGGTVVGQSPEHMAKFVAADRKRWGDVIKSANIPLVE